MQQTMSYLDDLDFNWDEDDDDEHNKQEQPHHISRSLTGSQRSARGTGLPQFRGRPLALPRKKTFPLEQIIAIDDTADLTLRLTSQLDDFKQFLNEDCLSVDITVKVLKMVHTASGCDLHRESVGKIVQVVCFSRLFGVHLAPVIQKLKVGVGI